MQGRANTHAILFFIIVLLHHLVAALDPTAVLGIFPAPGSDQDEGEIRSFLHLDGLSGSDQDEAGADALNDHYTNLRRMPSQFAPAVDDARRARHKRKTILDQILSIEEAHEHAINNDDSRQLRGGQARTPFSSVTFLDSGLDEASDEASAPAASDASGNATGSVTHTNRNQEAMQGWFDSVLGPKSGYNKRLRPMPDCSAHDCSHRINVQLGIGFTKFLGINELKNQIKMLGVMTLKWPDYRLDFDSAGNMPAEMNWDSMKDWLAIDKDLVWVPDVQLANAASPLRWSFHPRIYLYDAVKRKTDGYNVVLQVPVAMTVKCNLVYDNFPFDKQTCPLFFRSWSANTEWLSLEGLKHPPGLFTSPGFHTSEGEALSDKNEEFDLQYVKMIDSLAKSNHAGESDQEFSEVVYVIHLKRFSHYYLGVIILPTTLMVLFSLGVFFIDPERGERLGVSMTLILTVMAVSFFTADSIPKSGGGDTWLQLFQTWCYMLVMFPLFVSLIVEILRRIHLERAKNKHAATGLTGLQSIGLEPTDDEAEASIDWKVDRVVRLPYGIAVLVFMIWVSLQVYVHCAEASVSIQATLVFMVFLAVGMFGLTMYEVFIGAKDYVLKAKDAVVTKSQELRSARIHAQERSGSPEPK
eukprot:gnl/TRDRNA2_/TRDRNA2_174021_c0_seq7.p1 gnl/TRDRNA2_/TRDRNA2_174021_c0~~gnl/TRDRNA2_/TRDRNA2_174021_c0_seq7.p1  ORF type:complete len:640 (+),score=72.54 gnl/TRDRNA2_/TRDRNA2_174021_c0_seq7:47-1966(+)